MSIAAAKKTPSPAWGVARLRRHLGMIPADRILLFPFSGPATAEDLLFLDDHHDVICELVDGILVRKPMGAEESMLALFLAGQLGNYLHKHDLGVLLGEAGFLELMPRQVRAPDISFISWDQLPEGRLPRKRIPALRPDLAVEILSEGNTPKEMLRKRSEYFAQGTRLVWQVDPAKKTIEVFTSADESKLLRLGQTLDGGDVLPGFKLALRKLFRAGRKRG